ncbi:uncharacterized protein LOC122648135 [Telopea speciosissima]|uniref:uncharacterized protein LOC122648135 n=1 Tax=Telopea speciosissima TaxID=54955 RepID=UPI001CC490F6|nr:uncharacterized protein LOC122648135 [Telopea speciosissima]
MEVLSRLFTAYQDLNLFKGVKVARTVPEISHLLFADDIFIFCKATSEDLLTIKAILDLFSDLSGQDINFFKSGIHFSRNVSSLDKANLCSVLGIKEMSKDAIYLGTNLFHGRSKVKELDSVVQRIQNKLSSWKSKFLSFAGRSVLIKSILAFTPAYLMNCFEFPIKICRSIDSIYLNFWLGNYGAQKKPVFIAWDRMCNSKSLGGLGFRKAEHHNKALLMKLGWRLLTDQSALWARVLKLSPLFSKILLV